MFGRPKYKKVDVISYKGYEMPIYSDGDNKFVGHPLDPGEDVKQNKIYQRHSTVKDCNI